MNNQEDKPNIIFILVDALRTKNIGCYGYSRNVSPNIDILAKKGVLFKNCFSSNNATDKSILAMLSGRHVLLSGARDMLLKKDELNSFFNSGGLLLQEILKKRGYKTYCLKEIHSWQKKGFDFFYSNSDLKEKNFLKSIKQNQKFRDLFRKIVHQLPKNIGDKIKAKYGRTNSIKVTKDAIQIIKDSKEKNEKFFMWIYYDDVHIPYNPKKFTGKFNAEEKSENFFKKISKRNYNPLLVKFWKGAFSKNSSINDIIARYDSAIAYDDYLIGKVIKILEKTKLIKNTIIFLFSDHGESLNEHGIYFDHHGLYDVCTNVPLIISGQGIPKNKKRVEFVQHEDLTPTILKILKIPHDPFFFDGKNLLPLIENNRKIRDFIFMEEGDKMKKRAIRTKNWKYIEAASKEDAKCSYCNEIHGGVLELYNLKKDPHEETNVIDVNKKIKATMKKKLDETIKDYKKLNEKRRIKKILLKINK